MAQKLADLRQGRAGAQKLRCRGVAQAMRLDVPKAGAPGGIRYDGTHAARAEHVMGRDVPDEHGPALGVRGAGVAQVFGQSEPDIGRQGHAFVTIALAAQGDRA